MLYNSVGYARTGCGDAQARRDPTPTSLRAQDAQDAAGLNEETPTSYSGRYGKCLLESESRMVEIRDSLPFVMGGAEAPHELCALMRGFRLCAFR